MPTHRRGSVLSRGDTQPLGGAILQIEAGEAPHSDHRPLVAPIVMTRTERDLLGQTGILELLASGAVLEQVLDVLCRYLEDMIPGSLCSILLLDDDGHRFCGGYSASLPAEFMAAIDGLAIGPRSGVCGTAAYRREPVIVVDTATDPLCSNFRDLADRFGLRACWSVPIRDGDADRVLGTFAVYHREPRCPTDDDLLLVHEMSHLASVAIRSKRSEEAIARSEGRFRALVEHTSDLVSVLDARLIRRYVSPSYEHVLGYRPEELLGRRIEEINHPDDVGIDRHVFAALARRPDASERFETRVRHKDGSVRWLEAIAVNHLDHPEIRGFVVNSRDVTERKVATERLAEVEARYRTLLESVPAITYVQRIDKPGTVYVSPQVKTILGWEPEDCQDDPDHWEKLLHPDDRERVMAEDARTNASGEPFDVEYRQRTCDGRYVWLHDQATIVRDAEGRPLYWQGLLVDVTERKTAEERLAHMAFHDPLTGLANRTRLMDRLQEVLASGTPPRPVAMMFLDLDGFKSVNDSLGHDAGDRLLIAVAERLRRCLGERGTVARFGGDEFAILLPDCGDRRNVSQTAERIAAAFRQPFVIGGVEATVSATLGVASVSPDLARSADLLRAADVALYRAKAHNKAGVAIFDPRLDLRTLLRLEQEAELGQAVERGELQIAYQPIIDLTSDEVLGVEALVRWQHPSRGVLQPAEFIPLAEETGLIIEIGRWVMAEACRQVGIWQRAYPSASPLRLSVNLSARQFRQPALISEIARILGETGLVAGSLSLDVAEGAAMADSEKTIAVLEDLQQLGVTVTIDDFGTGYAALSSLTRFAVGDLKIDRSCVVALGRRCGDTAIVRALIAMAKAVGLAVTAEGVETAEQLALLKRLGCDRAQGHHFAPPLGVAAVEEFLRQRETTHWWQGRGFNRARSSCRPRRLAPTDTTVGGSRIRRAQEFDVLGQSRAR